LTRLRAAISGLGRVGLLFDDDEKRRGVWTHFSAYERLAERYDLVAVCDLDPDRRERALARRPSLRAYASLEELLDAEQLDVLSVCTPDAVHAAQVEAAAGHVRAVVCEKPLSADLASAAAAVETCARAGTLLAVNYYKRFEETVQRAARLVADGDLGAISFAQATYSGPVDAVGSHALDLLTHFLGPLEVVDTTDGPGGTTALLTAGDGPAAVLAGSGSREQLVFELDVIGADGRIRILDNCAGLEVWRFEPSARYGGYRELVRTSVEHDVEGLPFVALFAELAHALAAGGGTLTSDGAAALVTQAALEGIRSRVGV
jgi:predicted dehydrogenase